MNYFKCLKENFSQWTLSCVNIYMPLEDKELNPGLNVGIYILICLWSGFAYVGASRRLRKRLKEHLDLLRRNRHSCKKLQKEWNEFGRECFALFPSNWFGTVQLFPRVSELGRGNVWWKQEFITSLMPY